MKALKSRIVLAGLIVPWMVTLFPSQESKNHVVPTIITNHYDKSEIKSHGVVTVNPETDRVTVSVRDLTKGREYSVVLLDEMRGDRAPLGNFKTDGKGGATFSSNTKGLLKTHNALLIMYDEDVIQYAQLQDSHHGCICKHSGGTIVTRRLDQECYECPCGVKYEICCGGIKK